MAGREATPAEIDALGQALLTIVPGISIVSEQHYEMGRGHEAVVHLVKIEIDAGESVDAELEDRLVSAAAN